MFCAVCITAFPDDKHRQAITVMQGYAVCLEHATDMAVWKSLTFDEHVEEARMDAAAKRREARHEAL